MKIFFLIAILYASSMCFAQSNQIQNIEEGKLSRTVENKNIGISHLTSDIISFSQLTNSHELTIENLPDWEIISYDLTYFITEGNSVGIYAGRGSEIPDSTIQDIIASGSNRILFENVIISQKGETTTAGYRNFYVN